MEDPPGSEPGSKSPKALRICVSNFVRNLGHKQKVAEGISIMDVFPELFGDELPCKDKDPAEVEVIPEV